jgi:flavin-dependent dehydrogenase
LPFDAVIIGAGTAGSAVALNLAPFRRVVLIEREAVPRWRIGESLPGAARWLLSDMGLLETFVADGHLPRHALCSAWGSAEPEVRDALADPDGHAWQIDRVRFEQRLRAEAVERGAAVLSPARVVAVDQQSNGWSVSVDQQGTPTQVTGHLLIAAAGRRSHGLIRHVARRRAGDRLGCAWIRASDVTLPAGVVHIEAEPDGWWYAAPVPGGDGILAFHTDADLSAARHERSTAALLARARALPMLGRLLSEPGWDAGQHGYCAAHGAWLEEAAGDAWLAVGDAALAVDPLAAQGLFNALYQGVAAAEAAHRWLAGERTALAGYAAAVAAIRDVYIAQRAAWYRLEQRWPDQPFWRRRHLQGTSPARSQDAS